MAVFSIVLCYQDFNEQVPCPVIGSRMRQLVSYSFFGGTAAYPVLCSRNGLKNVSSDPDVKDSLFLLGLLG